jgi:hypothetical protein
MVSVGRIGRCLWDTLGLYEEIKKSRAESTGGPRRRVTRLTARITKIVCRLKRYGVPKPLWR